MKYKKALFALALFGVLAGCQNQARETGPGMVPVSALTQAFVTDWTPYENAAAALRTQARYVIQNFSWLAPTPHYSLIHGRVEYAHAAGLTGTGQTISIVDDGFLPSHVEFTGKSISTPGGTTLPVNDHGTMVASIAAGVANYGQIIGVAPGANLLLGDFSNNNTTIAATQQAISQGAIVQNNSWGYALDGNATNFNNLFGSGSGADYLNTLKTFGENAVIVFAASNDTSLTKSDLMAALPAFAPTLEGSWITVVNATPAFSNGSIVSATMLSSRCLNAAAWCMAADGTIYGATSADNSSYAYGSGSSFAAPQVSGAIALLAQAFPGLDAKALRARLLASADNNFYSHTGYVEFAPGIKHGYDATYGHGFLNLKAALSPIGGAYMPLSNGGQISVSSPILLSGGMVGDTLTRSLSRYDLTFSDGLGAAFSKPANILSAQAVVAPNPLATLQELETANLHGPQANPFRSAPVFTRFANGEELTFESDDMRFAMLVPSDGSGAQSWGLALSRGFDTGAGTLRLGLSAMREGDGFVGLRSLVPASPLGGNHAAATLEWSVPLGRDQIISVSGSLGRADPDGNIADMGLSPVLYNALSIDYGLRNLFGRGDRLALGISLPDAVQSGSARVTIPVSTRSAGAAPTFNTLDIPLTPQRREIDLSLSYGFDLWRGSDLLFSATRRMNDGNIAGNNSTEAAVMLRFRF